MNRKSEFFIGDLVIVNPGDISDADVMALIIGKSRPDFVNLRENPYYKVLFCDEETPDERWIPATLLGGIEYRR